MFETFAQGTRRKASDSSSFLYLRRERIEVRVEASEEEMTKSRAKNDSQKKSALWDFPEGRGMKTRKILAYAFAS